MANALYPSGKKGFLDADIDLLTDTIKVRLVTSAYTFNSAHDFLDDTTGAVGTDQTLGSKTTTGGTFDAADPTWSSVAGGSTVDAYIIYKDTGSAATSNLVAYFDTDGNSDPISLATNGGDITITFNASGIFSL